MTKRDLPEYARLVPKNATKVFEGIIFDVYQWEQELFDGSYHTFEMLKRPDTVLIIALDENDQIVALREHQPSLPVREMRMPGGRVDPTDKTVLAAAQREMHEETGLSFGEWKLVEMVQPESKIEWFIYVYIARDITSRDEPHLDPGEEIEVNRVGYEEFREKNHDASRLKLFSDIKTTAELKTLFD